jgi:hypothetical protein
MSDPHECRCRNPVASWSDRELRWVPRWLLAFILFGLYSGFVHPPGPRHAVVAGVTAILCGPIWFFLRRACRLELRWRAIAATQRDPYSGHRSSTR